MSVSNGSLSLGAATSTINGPLTVSGSGTLALSGTTLIGTGTVTDAGKLTVSNSSGTALSNMTMASGSVADRGGCLRGASRGRRWQVDNGVNVTLQGINAVTSRSTSGRR